MRSELVIGQPSSGIRDAEPPTPLKLGMRLLLALGQSTESLPDQLIGVPGIQPLKAKRPGVVYFLVSRGEVVYVGQTSAAWPSRIESHLTEGSKEFDSVYYLEVPHADDLYSVEMRWIERLRPRYNYSGRPKPVVTDTAEAGACKSCGQPLTALQAQFCNPACRLAHWEWRNPRLREGMSEDEAREVYEAFCRRRHGG